MAGWLLRRCRGCRSVMAQGHAQLVLRARGRDADRRVVIVDEREARASSARRGSAARPRAISRRSDRPWMPRKTDIGRWCGRGPGAAALEGPRRLRGVVSRVRGPGSWRGESGGSMGRPNRTRGPAWARRGDPPGRDVVRIGAEGGARPRPTVRQSPPGSRVLLVEPETADHDGDPGAAGRPKSKWRA